MKKIMPDDLIGATVFVEVVHFPPAYNEIGTTVVSIEGKLIKHTGFWEVKTETSYGFSHVFLDKPVFTMKTGIPYFRMELR